jgi:hypothetical protein
MGDGLPDQNVRILLPAYLFSECNYSKNHPYALAAGDLNMISENS